MAKAELTRGATLAGFVESLQVPDEPEKQTIADIQVVVFDLDGSEYAIPIHAVREILRVPRIGRVPHAPENVRGVINVRGQILPVIELRTRLGLEPLDPGSQARVLVVESGDRVAGLLVDRVRHVLRIPEDTLVQGDKLPATTGKSVAALAQLGDRLIIMLDLDQTLWSEAS
jgi:purine-binding chemotaxis protein CheW